MRFEAGSARSLAIFVAGKSSEGQGAHVASGPSGLAARMRRKNAQPSSSGMPMSQIEDVGMKIPEDLHRRRSTSAPRTSAPAMRQHFGQRFARAYVVFHDQKPCPLDPRVRIAASERAVAMRCVLLAALD